MTIIQNEKDSKIKSLRSDHGVNLKMKFPKPFVRNMVFHIIFLPLEHHNKIVL